MSEFPTSICGISSMYGMPLYIDDNLGLRYESNQFRFPRSKKKRIRNKFKRDRKNWKTITFQDPKIYQIDGRIVLNKKALEQMRAEMKDFRTRVTHDDTPTATTL